MNGFCKQLIYLGLMTAPMLVIKYTWLASMADGNTDSFYLRFTKDAQNSLILGTSRAAQGINPRYFNTNDALRIRYALPVYNFSFTIGHSPYGEVYLEAVKRMHAKGSNGLFLLTVDPWALSTKVAIEDDISRYRENNLALATVQTLGERPNLAYLQQYYSRPWITFLTTGDSFTTVHDNGWLEVDVAMDEHSVSSRTAATLKTYRGLLAKREMSETRISFLEKTIQYLTKYGDVFLVRLPISSEMEEVEDTLCPGFDQRLGAIAENHKVDYLNLMDKRADVVFTDGNHVGRTSTRAVAETIISEILRKNSAD